MDISYIKHDLNSLFFKIGTAIGILEDYLDNEDLKDVLKIAKSSTEKLKAITHRIIILNKIEENKIKISKTTIDNTNININDIKIEHPLQIDQNLFNEILMALKDIDFYEMIINKTAVLKVKKVQSSLDKFNIEFIVYILKIFGIDTKVIIDEKES